MKNKFGIVTRASDPTKIGKAVKEGIVSELQEDKRAGLSYFESSNSKSELKRLLGLVYDADIIEIKTENMAENRKIKIDIPILQTTSYEKLRTYCEDMKTYKELMSDWEDKEIIFSSLCKSQMTHLRQSMTSREKEDLNEFISFLLKTFGISENVIWKELRQISNRTDESPLAFWFRLINLYFTARNIEPPNEITDKVTQREIQNIFLSGLKNNELKKMVMVKNIDFQNLAIETNNISMNLNDLNEVKNALEDMHVRGRSPFRGTD